MMTSEAQIALAVTAPQVWTRPGKGSMQASLSVHPWRGTFVLMTWTWIAAWRHACAPAGKLGVTARPGLC